MLSDLPGPTFYFLFLLRERRGKERDPERGEALGTIHRALAAIHGATCLVVLSSNSGFFAWKVGILLGELFPNFTAQMVAFPSGSGLHFMLFE